MVETALYFPYIRVPKGPWFTQVLLYWDKAAAIVPDAYHVDLDRHDEYMAALHREALIEYMDPTAAVGDLGGRDFTQPFLAAVDANLSCLERSREFTGIHVDKMSAAVFDELRFRGLATGIRRNGDQDWWVVEQSTAGAYMAYLASALCGRTSHAEGRMVPVTDQVQSIAALAAPSGDSVKARLRALQYSAITGVLPMPGGLIPPSELRQFKRSHGEQLRHLRVYLDARLAPIAIANQREAAEVREVVFADLGREINELMQHMNRRRWPRVGLGGLGIVAAGLAAASGVVTAGTSILALGLAVATGAVSLTGGTWTIVEAARRRPIDREPLAYAALAAARSRVTVPT